MIGLDREKIFVSNKNFMVQEEINDFAHIIGFNIVLKLTYTNENQIEYFKSQIINLYLLKSDKECSLLILLHKDDIYLN